MADLSQITLLTTPQVQGPQAVAQGSHSSSGALLAGIPAGTTLQGFIVNRDGSGNPIIRTDKGDIAFTSQFFLKIGSEVVIRVGNLAGSPIANLITVDGQPPDVAQKTSAFAQDPEVILSPSLQGSLKSQAAGALTPAANPQSLTVKGTVVAQPTQPDPSLPALPNGSNVALRVLSLDIPTATPPGAQALPPSIASTAAQVTSPFYATYARAAAAGNAAPGSSTTTPVTVTVAPPLPEDTATAALQAPPTTAVTLLPQSPVRTATPGANAQAAPVTTAATPAAASLPAAGAPPVEAAAALPPAIGGTLPVTTHPGGDVPTIVGQPATQAPAPLTGSPPSGGILSATVIHHEVSGEPILHTPLGLIRLAAENPLPDGSHIRFELEANPAVAGLAAGASPGIPAPLPELAQHWNSLQQIFALLSGRSTLTELDSLLTPQTALAGETARHPRLPDGKQISLAFLTFLTALKRGDFNNWLGYSNIRHLRAQGGEELLKKAAGEFSGLSTRYTQATPDQWQPVFFPIAVDGLIQQVRMYVKKDRKQENRNEGRKEEDARFVIEVDLSALGEIQMDGFVRKDKSELHFDMVIRSLMGFTPDMQQDILKIYNEMGEITGFKGALRFQAVRAFPVNPMEDLLSDNDDVMA